MKGRKMKRITWVLFSVVISIILAASNSISPILQTENPNPPETPVRLIFIHHSTGENWLNDENGGLARALQENNYYPSDTNYGWGPNTIGDRTDIPNWTEWFRSDNTDQIMQAVFTEGDVHSPFNRTLPNPGGENQVILFKSCFPNSALDGNPNDVPSAGSDLTVGNAKYKYNEILKYFKTRPDKLFIVITSPPLSDPSLAANARAFTQWLVNDWLRENNYTQPNVAVFNFYNVLTSPNNHHRFNKGVIENLITDNRNTEYYPSEDDHPSRQGNLKATQEFLPLLNIFYNRWKVSAPAQVNAQQQLNVPTIETSVITPQDTSPSSSSVLFDFEVNQPVWETSVDEAVQSTMQCGPDPSSAATGENSLRIDFNVLANSWATCSSFFNGPRDLSSAEGIQFMMQVEKPGNVLHVDVFTGPNGERATYARELSYPESSGKWVPVQIKWSDLKRVEWETEGGTVFNHPEQITGIAFGFPAGETVNKGIIRVDDIKAYSVSVAPVQSVKPVPTLDEEKPGIVEQSGKEEQPIQKKTEPRKLFPFCGSIAIVPFGILISRGLKKRRS
jgi:hypothetical protein